MLDTAQLRHFAETQLRLPGPLHDYQWEGVAFLHRSHSALLADEMGLGKTIQTAIALTLLLNGQNDIKRALIVAPASLTLNWVTELATWAPSLTVRRVQGTSNNRKAFYLLPIPVLVSSYEQIRSDSLDRIPSNTFDLVILDEAQRIKNRDSTTALACRLLPRKRSWALSATPLENNQDDVVSILSFLDPTLKKYLSKNQLLNQLESLMLRRKKSEVRSELPPVILQDINIDLSSPQRETYDALWANRAVSIISKSSKDNINTALLGLITRLKIVCNYDERSHASTKLETFKIISEGAGESARMLVFSQFVKTLQWVSDRIELPHNLLTGSMDLSERQAAIDQFKRGPAPRALLVSLRAGGVGLNLDEATHVILFDRWWNPAVEMQAIYRAHRFDRTDPLHVFRFLVTDSIEEQIAAILDQKEDLFEEIVESTGTCAKGFTRKELMRILELSARDIVPKTLHEPNRN